MILIDYHPTGAYILYDPEINKVVISRDVVIDESKEWSWKQDSTSNQALQENNTENHAFVTLKKEPTINEENTTTDQAIIRSNRARTQSVRLNDLEVFPDTIVNDDGELQEEAMMAEAKSINLKQAPGDPNCLAAMKDELESIKKNKTSELVD